MENAYFLKSMCKLIPLGGIFEDYILEQLSNFYSESIINYTKKYIEKNYEKEKRDTVYGDICTILGTVEECIDKLEYYEDFYKEDQQVDLIENTSFVYWAIEKSVELAFVRYEMKNVQETVDEKNAAVIALRGMTLLERNILLKYVHNGRTITNNEEEDPKSSADGLHYNRNKSTVEFKAEYEEHIIRELQKRINGKGGDESFGRVCDACLRYGEINETLL